MPVKTVQDALNDPSFKTLAPDVQRAVLTKLGVGHDTAEKVLLRFSTHTATAAAATVDKYLASGQPTSVQREPGKGAPASFLTRMGKRIAGNIRTGMDPEAFSESLIQARKEMPPGGYLSKEGLARMYQGLKQTYRDPANIAGDVTTAYIAHEAGGGERPGGPASASTDTGLPWWKRRVTAPEAPETTITPEQRVAYSEALDKANRTHAQALTDYAETEARNVAESARKKLGVRKSEADAIAAGNKKQILERASDEYARLAQENIRSTHQTERARLDSRWHTFWGKKMKGATVPKTDLFNTIQDARAKLAGAPADLKQFNDLIRTMGIEVGEEGQITVMEKGVSVEMPVKQAHVHSSAIGDRLAAGDLPGNVYQALKTAKEGIEGSIERVADQYGQGDTYRALKRDWSRYMHAWNDMRPVATGKGSVLARALRAPNPTFLRPLLTGKGGDLLLEDLGKYRDAGSRPELAQQSRVLANRAQSIKAPSVRSMPPGYEPGPMPQLKEVPIPKPGAAGAVKGKPTPRMLKAIGRVGGKIGGVALFPHHPLRGMVIGGEVGGEMTDRLYQKMQAPRNRALAPVPPDLELPE
jgi:hypothetical protein